MNNWISNFKKIGIKVKKIFKKQAQSPEDSDWANCPICKKINYKPDLHKNLYICECSFHFDLPPKLRLDSLLEPGYEIIEPKSTINPDPLSFEVTDGVREGYKYIDKIKKYRKITGQDTALLIASGNISNLSAMVVCFNPKFGGGRFGSESKRNLGGKSK
jgi:acetyl-CoA carboxylase carboxyl transferase subunit beta